MTASTTNSKFANGDKSLNKNTTAESRRASKPLMEKRRRARINQSLAVLKSLIVDSQRVEGKQAKLEKADILEMTVLHLQSVKKSDEQKFLEGFDECFSETTRFLEKSKTTPGMLDKLTEHLKMFKQNLDLPTSFSEAVPSHLLHPMPNGGGISSVLVEKEDTVKLLSHLEQPSTTTTTESSQDPSCPTTATFALNVPRLKREASLSPNLNKGRIKRAPSSTHSSSTCLSPSFSNDSNNNNNFANPEVDGGSGGFRRGQLSPQSLTSNMMVLEQQQRGYSPHPGSVESFDRLRSQNYAIPQLTSPVPNNCNNNNSNAYVLNLSTQSSSFTGYCSSTNPTGRDQPMQEDDYCEPLDFSKPLNLSKNEVMDDQGRTWRPW